MILDDLLQCAVNLKRLATNCAGQYFVLHIAAYFRYVLVIAHLLSRTGMAFRASLSLKRGPVERSGKVTAMYISWIAPRSIPN